MEKGELRTRVKKTNIVVDEPDDDLLVYVLDKNLHVNQSFY